MLTKYFLFLFRKFNRRNKHVVKDLHRWASPSCSGKRQSRARRCFFEVITQVSHLINGNYLKRASPKAANIHNRWWRERSERNLRFQCKLIWRPRRGRTQANCANIPYVRPLRGRFYHQSLNRRLRCLRQLNQRLWIFAAFGDALASDKVERGDAFQRW